MAGESADEPKPAFEASITEDWCGPETLCGTATTTAGERTVRTTLDSFVQLPSGDFADSHTSTLTLDAGTVVIRIDGTLCPTAADEFTFTGSYVVVGGTGAFTGATGEGEASASREAGPAHGRLVGTLTLP